MSSLPWSDGADELVLAALAEEPALLRVVLGECLAGEATGELSDAKASILSLTVVVERLWRLSVSSTLDLTARRGSLGGMGAAKVWEVDL